MRFANISNYLSNSAAAVGKFAKATGTYFGEGLKQGQTSFGRVISPYGNFAQATKYASQGNIPLAIAAGGLDVLTDASRSAYWFLNHSLAVTGNIGEAVGEKMGLDPRSTQLLKRATQFTTAASAGLVANPLTGARPAGYKSIMPVSKEEDPTGRTSSAPIAESVLRYFTGRRGDPLPYRTLKEERPEIAYPTYSKYLKYKHMKPDGLLKVDPESQSFVGPLGIIRGTAQGLNEPEINYFGVPITASTAAATGAMLGTTAAAYKAVPESMKTVVTSRGFSPEQIAQKKDLQSRIAKLSAEYKMGVGGEATRGQLNLAKKQMREIRPELIKGPSGGTMAAVIGAGALAALGTKQLTKQFFNQRAEQQLKEKQPVEYLKHKHGSFQAASEALGNPGVRSWQELTPYMNE